MNESSSNESLSCSQSTGTSGFVGVNLSQNVDEYVRSGLSAQYRLLCSLMGSSCAGAGLNGLGSELLLLGVDGSFSARITSSHKFRAMFLSRLLSQTATLVVGSSCNVRYTCTNRMFEFSVVQRAARVPQRASVVGWRSPRGDAETGEW